MSPHDPVLPHERRTPAEPAVGSGSVVSGSDDELEPSDGAPDVENTPDASSQGAASAGPDATGSDVAGPDAAGPDAEGPPRGAGALRDAGAPHGPAGALLDTATQHDTLGGVDTDRPSDGDGAVDSWLDGGRVADRFRVVRQIGQGGMGRVYLAHDDALKREVALKRIPREILFDLDARDDLRQEANRLLDLAHEHIVRVHTYYDGPTWPFFAMEHLEGPTLKQLARERRHAERAFSPEEILEVARQVGEGLSYAHAHHVVHRDLKPANLMLAKQPQSELLGPDDLVKITDFGISRVVADGTLRHTGKRSGTLPYMSPEQFLGEPCTPRSDIYSFACTLYELATGQPPFYTGEVGYQILHVAPKPIENLPRAMGDAILRGLSKDPGARFETVEEFVSALEGGVTSVPRRSSGAWRTTLTRISATLALIGTIWIAAFALTALGPNESGDSPRDRASADPGARLSDRGAGVARSVSLSERQDRILFSEWLRVVLDEQLPPAVGARRGVVGPARDTLSFHVDLRETEAPRGASFLSRLVFTKERADRDGALTRDEIRGRAIGDVWRFEFRDVRPGAYRVGAHVESKTTRALEFAVLADRSLRVDLEAPQFDLAAVRPDLLVERVDDSGPAFATFDDSVEVRILGAGSDDDIASAYFQVVSPVGVTERQRVADLNRQRIALPIQGVPRKLILTVVDTAGNQSQPREFSFLRRRIELERFDVVGTRGNLVEVEGRYRVEGDLLPELVFFVNGSRTTVEATILEESDAYPEVPDHARATAIPESESTGATRLHIVPFRARLPVDRASNTIEVRYAVGDATRSIGDSTRSFGAGATAVGVTLPAPRVSLRVTKGASDVPPPSDVAISTLERTVHSREQQVTVFGSLPDYFDGLGVVLWVQVLDDVTKRSRKVDLRVSGSLATFEEPIELVPNRVHSISVECYFHSATETLRGEEVVLSVASDTVPPRATIEFELDGDEAVARIHASERLSALSGRADANQSPVDIPLEAVRAESAFVYSWRFPAPLSTELRTVNLTMRDLAGNEGSATRFWIPGASSARSRRAESTVFAPRLFRSPFVRSHDMSFIPVAADGLEVGSTEVPESAWFAYLEEFGLREEGARPGARDEPMVIADHPTKVVKGFVKWFEAKAADGYAYYIPTADEWLSAFAGVEGRAQALTEIDLWFATRLSIGRAEAYGQNRPSRIGARPQNSTPTRLLDMESNLQEIVLDERGLEGVIGGHNQLDDREKMRRACRASRPFDREQRALLGRFTGLRLCRRPVTTRD